ncbi:MAG: carboxypeptidase regulatory-like domain-containing protein, partial [Candidatus Rokubacteria bacterium]|nr:carboxypeptidase regulatory-like domain-containing protein [Candidatus Rokubacteria bacterium]
MAGISDLYPDAGFNKATGSISGRVTKNGKGLFGAHIVAFNPATGTLVSNFALNADGAFTINGLSPGPHVVRVEPLDDADL